MSKYSKRKTTYTSSISIKSIILAFIFVIIFVVFIILWLSALFSEPKTPATADEVWVAIEEQGYHPEDISDYYFQKDSGFKVSLKKCIAFEKEDIHFEFFEFNNKDSAIDIYGQAYHNIRVTHNSWQKMETSYENKNYSLYFLDSHGKYNVSIFVENTAVYAYCDSENKYEINRILDKIDYLTSGNNKEKTE